MDIFLIRQPLITEKATDLEASRKYCFKVSAKATRSEVRKAVKEVYRVDASKINMMNVKSRTRRFRGKRGRTPTYRKAIVTLVEGQKIDLGK